MDVASLEEGQSAIESLKQTIAEQASQLQADDQEYDSLLQKLGEWEWLT